MARPLNVREVKERIKANKAAMKVTKKEVTDAMVKASKEFVIDPDATRKSLATFIKASKAVEKDMAKLEPVED